MDAIKVLVIDGSQATRDLLADAALPQNLNVMSESFDSPAAAEQALQWFEPDLVLTDRDSPGAESHALPTLVRRVRPDVPLVLVADGLSEQEQVDALRGGALDCVPRGDRVRMMAALRSALREAHERRARRRAESALKESELRFRLFMEHLPGAAFIKDLEGRFTYVNPSAERIVGRPVHKIIGRTLADLYPPAVAARYSAGDEHALKLRQVVEIIEQADTPDGPRSFLSVRFPIPGADGHAAMVGGIALDVTERDAQQRQLARVSRMHAVISGINTSILSVHDRDVLFKDACRIAVEEGGFRMAWIGLADPGQSKVTPVASHGLDRDYLGAVGRSLEATAEARELTGWSVQYESWDTGLAARAVRENQVIVCDDIESDPRVMFRREALASGFRSLIALPLTVADRPLGMMMMFSGDRGVFDDAELKLLHTLSANISFALDHLNSERQLSFVSWYDGLTELPNRALFVDRLSQLLRADQERQRGVSVLLFDLKRFRDVNALAGRAGGDHVLKVFATRLKSVFGGTVGTVARIGGDRFAAAVRGTRIAALSTLGDDHWDGTLVAPIRVGGTEVRVPYRLGISVAPADGNDAEQLYRQAEAALHRAQAAGDTCVYFSAAINALAASRFELGARLRRAVEAREFVLHYQPKVDLRSRRLVGVEALLRWRNPQGETVQPAEFVPVLEETGLIIDVGRWAIEQAVADIAWWQTCGLRPPRVSLNVSAVQLRQPNFVGQLLAASGGPQNAAAMIDLEVTEGERAQDMGPAMEALQQLRQLGVGVIMDDFGTGRSSLSQLTELPVSAVKIDRSLVQDLASRPAALAIVVSVIGLAQSLGITSLAEGVEDEATASRLHELGCDQAQGFLFGRPVAANAVATLLQSVEASGAGSAAVSPLRSSRRSR